MKRTKRFTIRRLALGLAVAAVVPATAQARPMDVSGQDLRVVHAQAVADVQQQSTVEIPYLSQGVGVTAADLGVGSSRHPDDRAFSRQSSVAQTPVDFWNYDPRTGEKITNSSPGVAPGELAQLWGGSQAQASVEIPYLSHGVGVTAADLGIGVSRHPDDRTFSKASSVDPTPVVTDNGGYDISPGTVGGFAIALILAAGSAALAIRHNRRTKLSPA